MHGHFYASTRLHSKEALIIKSPIMKLVTANEFWYWKAYGDISENSLLGISHVSECTGSLVERL